MNNRGGYREGAGRKQERPSGCSSKSIYCTASEAEQLKRCLQVIRVKDKIQAVKADALDFILIGDGIPKSTRVSLALVADELLEGLNDGQEEG